MKAAARLTARTLTIANTKDAGCIAREHYSMDSFSFNVPNGKYIAKLHFAETLRRHHGRGPAGLHLQRPGPRVQGLRRVEEGRGPNRAYVETVPVEVTDGKFKITFTSNVENPQINAIEIIPQATAETSQVTPARVMPFCKSTRAKSPAP